MIRFLDRKRLFDTAAILEEECLRDYYPSCHQEIEVQTNKEWLTLLNKLFFPFARELLLNEIRQIVNVKEWKRRGNGVMMEAAAKTTLEEN